RPDGWIPDVLELLAIKIRERERVRFEIGQGGGLTDLPGHHVHCPATGGIQIRIVTHGGEAATAVKRKSQYPSQDQATQPERDQDFRPGHTARFSRTGL